MIQHWLSPGSFQLSDCLEHLLGSRTRARELLVGGAVFLNKKRVREDCRIVPGDYLRVHPNPKRYFVDYDWRARIVKETPDYVLVDKPSGVPTHATLDNAEENLVVQVSRALSTPLWVTHRLDIPASGIVCLGKTREFQAWFNKMLRKHKVRKFYRALTENSVPCGRHEAFQEVSPRAPKKMSMEEKPGWLPCSLEVLSCRAIEAGHEVEIELFTGRTHQIRAQLALLGAPILNDTLYGGKRIQEREDAIALEAFRLEFPEGQYNATSTLPSSVIQAR